MKPRRSSQKSAQRPGQQPAPESPQCPTSATHAAVAWSGVTCLLLAVTAINFWPPGHQIARLGLIVMAATAIGVFVPDLLWRRVQRRTLVAPRSGSWSRSITKVRQRHDRPGWQDRGVS